VVLFAWHVVPEYRRRVMGVRFGDQETRAAYRAGGRSRPRRLRLVANAYLFPYARAWLRLDGGTPPLEPVTTAGPASGRRRAGADVGLGY
jgi:hypothetical protein